MTPGIVMVSNYVVGSKKNYSGIIDQYERYEKKNGNKLIYADDIYRMESAIEDENILLSKNEKKMLKDYGDYLKEGGKESLINFIKENEREGEVVYGNYINYMNKNIKASGLFGDNSDHFSFEEKIAMKEAFNKGQDNGSVLWGNVYSFDNDFLEKYNLMDSKTGYLNEIKIKEAVRESVRVMMREEKIDMSAVWCGEIHYDTDNIHVHTSIVEMKNTRPMIEVEKKKRIDSKTYEGTGEFELQPKAKIKKKTIYKMKSTFAHKLIDRTQELELISDLRFKLHHSIDIDERDIKQKMLLKKVVEHLPEDKNKWQYNNKAMENLRPMIDLYNENYLNKYHKEEYDEYKSLLNKQEEYFKEIYGEGQTDRYKDYSKNKISELKSKMGNELLREIKTDDKKIVYQKKHEATDKKTENKNIRMISREDYRKNFNQPGTHSKIQFKQSINIHKVNKAIKTTFRSERRNHELEYQNSQLNRNIERDLQRQQYQNDYGR